MKSRRLLLAGELTKTVFEQIDADPGKQRLLMRAGTIVDATIIAATSSTQNVSGERYRDKHQAEKRNQRHREFKAHLDMDTESGLAHSAVRPVVNTNGVTQTGALVHGGETEAFGAPGIAGSPSAAKITVRNGTSPGSRANASC